MKKIIFIIGVFLLLSTLITDEVVAVDCSIFDYTKPLYETSSEVKFTMGPVASGMQYIIEADCPSLLPPTQKSPPLNPNGNSVSHTFQRSTASCIFAGGTHKISLWRIGADAPVCKNTYSVGSECNLIIKPSTNPSTEDSITISGTGVPGRANYIHVRGNIMKDFGIKANSDGTLEKSIGKLDSSGWYTITVVEVLRQGGASLNVGCPRLDIFVYQAGGEPPPAGGPTEYDPCGGAKGDALVACKNCLEGKTLNDKDGKPIEGSWTALGCVPNKPEEFVGWLLARAVGIGGGIAFLIMLWGGFQLITSSGDPQKLNNGKETITSAAIGLLFIIFSVVLMKIIGVDILGLPGFNP